jgi:uncharacterized membrane protein YGL010W
MKTQFNHRDIVMTRYDDMMQIYASHHTKKITQFTHLIGVPCIILALQIFFSLFTISGFNHTINIAWLLFLGLSAYYLYLNVRLAISTAAMLLALTLAALLITHNETNFTSLKIFFFMFIGGWALQFIGHFFEGKKPAFLTSIFQIFIAPLFVVKEFKTILGR